MAPVLLFEAEYEAPPVLVQRKYFSSLERRRIAESAFRPRRQSSTTDSTANPITRARRRLKKQHDIRQNYNISQAEAQWFLSLPDKVRRRQFSREEQVILAGGAETDILDPADEPFYQEQLEHDRAKYLGQAVTDFNHLQERVELFKDKESRGRPRRRHSIHDSVINRSSGEENDLDGETFIHLDEMSPPEPAMPEPVTNKGHRRRSSFKRTLSITAIPLPFALGRHSTSSMPGTPSTQFFSSNQQTWRPRAHSNSGPQFVSKPAMPIYDPEATHYRDPEARKKLRLYLASAQKFDEALEYGFPSDGISATAPQLHLPREVTHARKISHDVQTFLKEDKVSFFEDHDDDNMSSSPPDSDDDSICELESPVTPSDPTPFHHPARLPSSNFSSLDSAGLPLFHPMHGRSKASDHLYAQALTGNREMTLRMTLTRPDLRADEDTLYGWYGGHKGTRERDDPLALEELNLTDDMTGSRGAFAVKSNSAKGLVSRFFSKVKTLQKA